MTEHVEIKKWIIIDERFEIDVGFNRSLKWPGNICQIPQRPTGVNYEVISAAGLQSQARNLIANGQKPLCDWE